MLSKMSNFGHNLISWEWCVLYCRLARAILVIMTIIQMLVTANRILCTARDLCAGVATQTGKIMGVHASWSIYSKFTQWFGLTQAVPNVVTPKYSEALIMSLKTADYSAILKSWVVIAFQQAAIGFLQ